MGYVKTVWAADTEITSSLLNHLETQYSEAKGDVDNHDHDADYYPKAGMNSGFWHAGNVGAGSGCDADTIDGHEAAYFDGIGAPSGIIIMHAGDVPAGWHLCNGANGTPDMRDRFALGAGSTYAVGQTGGSAAVTPTATLTIAVHILTVAQIPVHDHTYTDKYATSPNDRDYTYAVASIDPSYDHTRYTTYIGGGGSHGHAGSTYTGASQENRPPYYALKFIMKG